MIKVQSENSNDDRILRFRCRAGYCQQRYTKGQRKLRYQIGFCSKNTRQQSIEPKRRHFQILAFPQAKHFLHYADP